MQFRLYPSFQMTEHSKETRDTNFIHELTVNQTSIGAFIRSLLPVHADTDAVLQEVNITLWQKKDHFEIGTNFRAWAFQTAKYCALNERKRLKKSRLIVLDDAVLELIASTGEFCSEGMSKRRMALDRCLERLNSKERELLRIRYTKGYSLEKYGREKGRNPGTLRATLRRIRIRLKHCVFYQLRENDPA